MTPHAKISQVAHYVPQQKVSNHELATIMDTNDEWISSRTGIRNRHIVETQQTSDLAIEVAKQLLEKSELEAQEIDFIIVATITPDAMMPSTASKVQAAIGATSAFAYDLVAACSGFVFAISTAEKLIASGVYKKGIVIGAEVLSKTIDWADRSTAVLFGDGAGGVLIEASTQASFIAETLRTDGTRGHHLTSGYAGLTAPFSEKSPHQPFLKMDGRAIFEFAIRDVAGSISDLLDREGLNSAQVDYFLLHQANHRILTKMAKKLGADESKFPANMMEYGNTSAASIPILLSECVEKGMIRLDGSQTVLMSGFGGGLTWGSLILKL
ncbi:beta-ketoacyl-ACP synthase III [Streptococcus cameli]